MNPKAARYRMILVSLLLLITISGCGKKGGKIVARVGTRSILLSRFEEEFARGKTEAMLKAATFEDKKNHLQTIIDSELEIIEAYRKHLDKDKELLNSLSEREKRLVGNKLWETAIVDKIIPQSRVKEFYKKSKKEVKVSHILLKVPPGADPNIEKEVEKNILELLKRAQAGEDFTSLARRYSEDTNTAKNGGDKGYLKWGDSSLDEAFMKTAFSLKKGEISGPIKTKEGFHIIRVDDIRVVPQKHWEEEKPKIRNRLMTQRNKELETAYYAFINKLKEKYRVSYNEANIFLFLKELTVTDQDKSDNRSQPLAGIITRLAQEDSGRMLISFTKGQITGKDLAGQLQRYLSFRQERIDEEKEIRDLLDRLLAYELFVAEAYQRGFKKDKEVQKEMRERLEDSMKTKIVKMEVDDKTTFTDDEYKKYFEENRDHYMHPERREVQEIFVKNEKLAQEIARKARAGQNFDKLAEKYNERTTTKEKKGTLGLITSNQYGAVGKRAFQLRVGEISEPIKMGTSFSVIKLLAIHPPEPKSYEEAQNQVKGDLRKKLRAERLEDWHEQLRQKMNFVIYEDVLRSSFSHL